MVTKGQQNRIRVLVVDDSAFVRRAIIKMFEASSTIQVVDVAGDGEMAVELIKKLHPDVVTLDVQMPVLDGLSALERIMRECPTPVVMLSSLTGRGGDKTLKALELGAVDFIDKSAAGGPMDIAALARELTMKIQVAARVDVSKLKTGLRAKTVEKPSTSPPEQPAAPVKPPVPGGPVVATGGPELVLIGTSTGGPPALQTILASVPAGFPCPILIVQHMPVGFTASLAERLDRLSRISVKEAADGERIVSGTAYLAPAGTHMKIRRSGGDLFVVLDLSPENSLHRPSVDSLLESAAAVSGTRCVAFILTGMGRDGAAGAVEVKRRGGRVLVEAEETAIVFGMPKAVMETVAVDGVIPLYQVTETLVKLTAA